MEEHKVAQIEIKDDQMVITDDGKKYRLDESWTDQHETLLNKWKDICVTKDQQHTAAGYHFKKRYAFWKLPSIIFPLAMSPFTLIFQDSPEIGIVNAASFTISAILSSVNNFFNYGQKEEKHFSQAFLFSELVIQIERELSKEKRFRNSPNQFILEMQYKLDNLLKIEPVLPQKL